ncbi:hypothetical protein SAMN05216330_105558 [Bradyrhizobium sp. Ghvi]|nr:hypothetical protein SAMN05216330_105558 [Bradyrhizobium sp. Ghvi]
MAETVHPFYEKHRGAMEAAMRRRLDLAEAMLRERTQLSDIDGIKREVMDELEIVLTQMPYVGGATSRMSDVFVRLTGFMATSRVLRRHGVPLPDIRDIERETYKAQLLAVPEAKAPRRGRSIHVPGKSGRAARAGDKKHDRGPPGRISGGFRLRFRRAGP